MTSNNNLVTEMAQEAHVLIGSVYRTLNAIEGAVKYVSSMTGENYGNEEVSRALSYANLARLELGMRKTNATSGKYESYIYDDEAANKRLAAYVTMLETAYGDSLEEITGVNVGTIEDVENANMSDLVALVKETGISLDWLMGGVA